MNRLRTCTRASTLAKALDAPSDGLMDYAAAVVLQALVGHPDLLNRALMMDPDAHWRTFKPLVKEAQNRRGKVEASEGTNIHSAVQAIAEGRDVSRLPDEVVRPARLVLAELDALGVEIVGNEVFTACLGRFGEDLAGTADLVLVHDGVLHIGDIKSVEEVGRNTRFSAMAWAAQTTIYAAGLPFPTGYEPKRDRWGRPMVDPTLMVPWSDPMSQDTSLVIEVARDASGVASHEIDLDTDLVELACKVRAARKRERT